MSRKLSEVCIFNLCNETMTIESGNLIYIITRGLYSYNARPLNDDVTAYWRRREFPNYARLHRCRISFHYLAIWRKSCFINDNWCMLKIIYCRLGHTKCLVTHKISSIIILDDVTLWKVMGNHWTCVVHKQRQMSWGLIRLTHPLHLAMRLTPPLVCIYMQQADKHRGINNRTSHSRHFK